MRGSRAGAGEVEVALGDVLEAALRLERKVDALGRRRAAADEVVTVREAARILRCDRSTTLQALIRAGYIMPVMIAGRPRIRRANIDRLLEVGASHAPPARRQRRPRVTPANDGAALRAIKLSDLLSRPKR